MRVLIEYGDHNDTFASALPICGEVESTPRATDSKLRWLLVKLDSALTYAGHDYRRLLIASRWTGRELNEANAVSVFTLLVPGSQSVKDGFSYRHFDHVAWCMAKVVAP